MDLANLARTMGLHGHMDATDVPRTFHGVPVGLAESPNR